MKKHNLANLPSLRDTVNQYHLPLAKIKDVAITDVEMTAEVYAYLFNRNELSTAINQLTKKTVSQNITSRTEIIIPAQMKLMNGSALPTNRLPKTICYIVCTGKGQKITLEQAKRLRKWLYKPSLDSTHETSTGQHWNLCRKRQIIC